MITPPPKKHVEERQILRPNIYSGFSNLVTLIPQYKSLIMKAIIILVINLQITILLLNII